MATVGVKGLNSSLVNWQTICLNCRLPFGMSVSVSYSLWSCSGAGVLCP